MVEAATIQKSYDAPDEQNALYSLEDPNVLPPDIHIYTSTQQHWLKLSEDIPRVEEYYQKKDYWPAESIERFDELMGK